MHIVYIHLYDTHFIFKIYTYTFYSTILVFIILLFINNTIEFIALYLCTKLLGIHRYNADMIDIFKS
ncbi:hypothetical protein [Albatrosspox virus]|nr:hypothetical protein [Penguinpox virus 2]QRM15990.1 hypothetical protein [Albatrosspox virus]